MITDMISATDPIARMIFVFLLKERLAVFVFIIPAFESAASTGLYSIMHTEALSSDFAKLKGKSTFGSRSITVATAASFGIPTNS